MQINLHADDCVYVCRVFSNGQPTAHNMDKNGSPNQGG